MSATREEAAWTAPRGAWWRRLFQERGLRGRAAAHEFNAILRDKRCRIRLCEETMAGSHYEWMRPMLTAFIAAEQAGMAQLEEGIRNAGGYAATDASPAPEARTQQEKLRMMWEMLREEIDRYHALLQMADNEGGDPTDPNERARRMVQDLLDDANHWDEELRTALMKL